MIPTIRERRRGRRGRPLGSRPLFVEDCLRINAIDLLAKSRGVPPSDEPVYYCPLTWTEYGQPRSRLVRLPVTTTPQPFGGVRRWWCCPSCGNRCGVLLVVAPDRPIACRRCHRARYAADYPWRHRVRWLAQSVHGTGGLFDERLERELTALMAPRRRGVRRGRRVLSRAIRAMGKFSAWPAAVTDMLNSWKTV